MWTVTIGTLDRIAFTIEKRQEAIKLVGTLMDLAEYADGFRIEVKKAPVGRQEQGEKVENPPYEV